MIELDKNITLLIIAQLNGTASQEDLNNLEQWLNMNALHKTLYSELKATIYSKQINHTEKQIESAFLKLDKTINKKPNIETITKANKKYSFPFKSVIGIAASILLILTIYLWRAESVKTDNSITQITKDCPRGQKLHVTLSDGTEVWLNSGSHISFPKIFAKDKRIVTLEGEAFFIVTKNELKPFVVNTSNSQIKVLGTSFNVNNQNINHITETTVITGKVLVSSIVNSQSVTLVKNQSALVNKQGEVQKKDEINPESTVDWKDNNLFFDNVPLEKVFEEIEPWFDITIELNDKSINQKKLRAKFSNPSLNQLLDYISKVNDITYKIEGKIVTIHISK
jgi:ferric-dicitrate binding protein FerR (iron transport regulator)